MARGNQNGKGKTAVRGPELAQKVRWALLKAMDILENDRKKSVPELLADKLEEDPIKFLELVSKYVPKDLNIFETNTTLERILDAIPDDEVSTFTKELRSFVAANHAASDGEEGTENNTAKGSTGIH